MKLFSVVFQALVSAFNILLSSREPLTDCAQSFRFFVLLSNFYISRRFFPLPMWIDRWNKSELNRKVYQCACEHFRNEKCSIEIVQWVFRDIFHRNNVYYVITVLSARKIAKLSRAFPARWDWNFLHSSYWKISKRSF